jgi:hypothetical protein
MKKAKYPSCFGLPTTPNGMAENGCDGCQFERVCHEEMRQNTMKNDRTFIGKFYLKSGAVIEDEIIIDKENDECIIKGLISDTKRLIKEAIKNGVEAQITFGNTILRATDISAVTFSVT